MSLSVSFISLPTFTSEIHCRRLIMSELGRSCALHLTVRDNPADVLTRPGVRGGHKRRATTILVDKLLVVLDKEESRRVPSLSLLAMLGGVGLSAQLVQIFLVELF